MLATWVDRSHATRLAHQDPAYRIGLHFTSLGETPAGGLPALEDDLQLAHEEMVEPSAEVFRLVAALRASTQGAEFNSSAAAALCEELRWARCSDDSLREMVRALAR